MTGPADISDLLNHAAVRFGNFVASWPGDVESENGLTRSDAGTVLGHVDLVLLFRGPNILSLAMVQEDDGVVQTAFDDFDAFATAWPAERIDLASQLTWADLDLIASERGPVFPRHP